MQKGIYVAKRVICDANSLIASQIIKFFFVIPFPRNKERAAFLFRIVNFRKKKHDILAVGRWPLAERGPGGRRRSGPGTGGWAGGDAAALSICDPSRMRAKPDRGR